jgi:CheY-like chemotaxis protein
LDEKETIQLEVLEGEGGQTPAVSAPVPILIVDNDINSADSLELMLHAADYPETRVAYSGHAALAIAATFQPSVVLLEVDLLDVNGYELAQTLRERARTPSLRLIALTTSREHEGRELARVAGFERYLLKPVAVLDLWNLLRMPSRGNS